ncbi:MAG: prepilin-type N-terminal cleavage/methylation domain-containing protein [Clostridiaceae bacterium]|jgi:prepilin-type N-terminal cleavage/methylation domain-containing protein|nr:prepilin-type N-terminal cleavage/methylation domain-containing protein [Clostridiaceae bacterium]
MTKRFGFTLAEVLITLGIIGVVAAMTMPTLMNATNGAQFKAAYKKALSAISQAVVLNVALDEYNLADTTDTTTGANATSIYTMLNKRMNVVKTADGALGYTIAEGANGEATADSNYTLFFNDGSAFSFPKEAKGCTLDATKGSTSRDSACKGFIDVNGQKKPNKFVKCDNGKTGNACEVTSPSDVYPVLFFDQTMIPNSDAARAVLYAK